MEDNEKLREQILWALCRYRDGGKKSVEVTASEIMQLIANSIPDMSKEWQVIEYKHIPTSEALGKPVIISDMNSKYWKDAQNNLDNEWVINAVKIGNEIYRCGDKVCWNAVVPKLYDTAINSFEIIGGEIHMNKIYNIMNLMTATNGMGVKCNFRHYKAPEPIQEEKKQNYELNIKFRCTPDEWEEIVKIVSNEIPNANMEFPAPVEKEPEVLLRTMDEVNITDPNTVIWGVTDQWQRLSWTARDVQAGMGAAYKWLSTKDKMDEYITRWKPQLSLEEVNQAIVSTAGIVPMYARERLYEIVKKVAEQKIKQQ